MIFLVSAEVRSCTSEQRVQVCVCVCVWVGGGGGGGGGGITSISGSTSIGHSSVQPSLSQDKTIPTDTIFGMVGHRYGMTKYGMAKTLNCTMHCPCQLRVLLISYPLTHSHGINCSSQPCSFLYACSPLLHSVQTGQSLLASYPRPTRGTRKSVDTWQNSRMCSVSIIV